MTPCASIITAFSSMAAVKSLIRAGRTICPFRHRVSITAATSLIQGLFGPRAMSDMLSARAVGNWCLFRLAAATMATR